MRMTLLLRLGDFYPPSPKAMIFHSVGDFNVNNSSFVNNKDPEKSGFYYLLQSVVKYTFGLPAIPTPTPAGGNGITQTQTLFREGIFLMEIIPKAVQLETSRLVNLLAPQFKSPKAVFAETSRLVNLLRLQCKYVNAVLLDRSKVDKSFPTQPNHFKAVLLKTSRLDNWFS